MHQDFDEPETPPRRMSPRGIAIVVAIVAVVLAVLVGGW